MKEVKPEQLSFQKEFAQFRRSVDERLMRLEVRPISPASLTIVRIQLQDPRQ
jgi:hypothetical protein